MSWNTILAIDPGNVESGWCLIDAETRKPLHFGKDLSWLVRLRLKHKEPHEIAYLEGVWDALRGRNGKWRKHPADPSLGSAARAARDRRAVYAARAPSR